MTSKELYEKLSTIYMALPNDESKQEFADLIIRLRPWISNPSHVNTIRVWIKHSGN